MRVFLRRQRQFAIGKLRQRAARAGNHNHFRAVFLGNAHRIQKLNRRARIGNHHQHVLRREHRRRHQLDMRVRIRHGGHAEAEKLMLRILRHNARIAHAVKLNAPRVRQHGNRVFQLVFVQTAARAEQCGGGVAQHFFHHVAHVVVGVQFGVHKRQTVLADAGREREFEFGQPLVAQAAAETNHRGLRHLRLLRDFRHRRVHKPFGLRQRAFRHLALRVRQRIQTLTNLA